ncbi:CAP domain-containing protein [Paenibacillus sp. NFR01]|uniref:CAP domain-containing protein n=1 Tax=Paenibacillus sp. NFR01 TaxID=1566279 RepID=UPI0008B23ECC|nr:CAP domain-containing protein [Paenibacillus sp. NFR01]SET49861.1 uncharacterized protein, YkwD family [Paenibacillus sp. NFR01]
MKNTMMNKLLGGSIAAVMALGISLPSHTQAASATETTVTSVNLAQFLQALQQYNFNGLTFTYTGAAPTTTKPAATPAPAVTAKPVATAKPVVTVKPTATPAPAATAKTAATPAATAAPAAGSSTATFEQQIVSLVNKERAAAGLKPVAGLDSLNKVAEAKATDMRANNYFSHTSPTYGSPFDMMASFGITYRAAGENIAMGQKTPQEVMTAWMNSAGHRANILSPNFNYIGVGFDNNYWVQEFIGK